MLTNDPYCKVLPKTFVFDDFIKYNRLR